MLTIHHTYHNPADGGYNTYTVKFGERGKILFWITTDGDDCQASHDILTESDYNGQILGYPTVEITALADWELKYFMRALREAIGSGNENLTYDDAAMAFALAKEILTARAQSVDPFHLLTEIGELVY